MTEESLKHNDWTKTHGGPYYVEVGKNIKVDYWSRENITVKGQSGNYTYNVTIENATQINDTIAEQTVTKTWIYYDYEPSSVEYYYYKDCVVKDMHPHAGLI